MYISIPHQPFLPSSHSDYLATSATALSKTLTMIQMFPLTNILNCLPPLLSSVSCSVCSQVFTYEILASSFLSLHKQSQDKNSWNFGQLLVGICTLDCKYFFIISENADSIDYREGRCMSISCSQISIIYCSSDLLCLIL